MGSTVFLWSFPVCNTIKRRPNAVRTAALGLFCVRSSVIYLTSGCAFSVISALCVNMEMLTKHSKQEWRQKHDIVLYSGNQLVVFFSSNTWNYTKLGHINLAAEKLAGLLGGDSAVIEVKYE